MTMDRGKWIATLMLFISVALTASQLDDDGETIALSVWVGQEVDLECADNSSDPTRRQWKSGDEIWLSRNKVVVNNNRVSSVNRSAIMRIVNVTLDDEGYYTCTAYTLPPHTRTLHTRTLRLQVKEKPCEAPEKPLNGDFEGGTDTYRTGNTIRYHCHRGYQLIGESNRTCTGTIKGWQPHKPYCQPEYIGPLLIRLNGIEAEMSVFKQSIAALENKTEQIINNMSGLENKVAAIENMSKKDLFNEQIDRERLSACTNVTKAIDEDTVTKCKTMQSGVRNGHSVSVFTWVIDDYSKKVENPERDQYSQPFYHTVPGYKFRLIGKIHPDSDIYIYLQLLPGEFDDQLQWPFSQKYELPVLTNVGHEVTHRSFSGEQSYCHMNRPTSPTDFTCSDYNYGWAEVWTSKKHILSNDSVVAKLYFYN